MQHIDCRATIGAVDLSDILPDECTKCGVYVHHTNCVDCQAAESRISDNEMWAYHNNDHKS